MTERCKPEREPCEYLNTTTGTCHYPSSNNRPQCPPGASPPNCTVPAGVGFADRTQDEWKDFMHHMMDEEKRLRADLEAANTRIARMAPVVEAAVAYMDTGVTWDDDKQWQDLCAAVEKYEEGK